MYFHTLKLNFHGFPQGFQFHGFPQGFQQNIIPYWNFTFTSMKAPRKPNVKVQLSPSKNIVKNDEKYFLFCLKSSFRSQDI